MTGAIPLRVAVCGTTFGQVYLEGIARARSHGFELAGVLARNSERSAHCAAHYGVPLFSDPDELAGRVDIACVVVRSGLLGGGGTQLAQALMERGVHVIQEHPLHHDELAACLRTARANGVVHHLNSFYPNVPVVRRFVAASRQLLAGGPATYVDAACGFQLAYSLLDILGLALGAVRPWALSTPAAPPASSGAGAGDVPFRSIEGVLGGVPLTLRVQNQMDPSDPDNHAHLDHRITLASDAGNLMLVNTHGPIVFSHRPRYPHAPRDERSRPHFDTGPSDKPPSATVLGVAEASSFSEIFRTMWPSAVLNALEDMQAAILGGDSWLRRAQLQLSVTLLWQDIATKLGPPQLIRRDAPAPLTGDGLDAVVDAGTQLVARA